MLFPLAGPRERVERIPIRLLRIPSGNVNSRIVLEEMKRRRLRPVNLEELLAIAARKGKSNPSPQREGGREARQSFPGWVVGPEGRAARAGGRAFRPEGRAGRF